MTIDAFLFKLLILSIPGVIVLGIYKKVAVVRYSRKYSYNVSDLFSVLVFSIICCFLYDLGGNLFSKICNTSIDSVLKKLLNTNIFTSFELLLLSVVAVFVGMILSLLETKKVLYKIVRKLKISTHYGDDDVWTFFCNSPDTVWIFVRDHKNDLLYFGMLEQYSDPGELRELLLSDVTVYMNSNTDEPLYKTSKVYLSRLHDEISIEYVSNKEDTNARSSGRKSKVIKRGK